ncbi:zinc ribbon domain-containing protein [Natrinema salsiterrestre]|uniref:Zinc ribbon domain-containing protein n=1 Tax=Natrinema salsiterrestre TaxID=2950540 RepID=A0A9Q4Q2M7_9EURY|nr:zinc ribbon domain-containing protein [Natrinema salsiterrestre]MDF9745097.1 zinc ribbon domain-containing protein [Natrinema salsiterrestre]
MRSKRVQREVDELVAQGWTIEEETPDRVVMVDREFGSILSHVLVALLTFWFTMGVGNLVWGAYNYVSKSRRRVLWDDGTSCPSCGVDVPPSADYCPACGDDLESVTDPNGGIACPECDAVAAEGSRFCPACGTKLAATFGGSAGNRTDT